MKLTILRVVVVLKCTRSFEKNSLFHLSCVGKMKQTIFLLFSLSCKFPDLNFAPYILYIYSCYETCTWHKQ